MLKKNKEQKIEGVSAKVQSPPSHFSVFQIVIFAFLFVIMIWIIGFLSLELDNQKQEIIKLKDSISSLKDNNDEVFKFYVDKIREFQKIDIKDQVQTYGADLKESIQKVRDLMFDKNDLHQVHKRIATLEEYNDTYRGANLVLLTSVGILRDVINKGDNFEVELGILEVVGGKKIEMIEIVETLKPLSKTGVKPFSQLKMEFAKIAKDVVFVANNPLDKNANYKDRFWFRLKSLIKLRKIDMNGVMDSPDNIVARAEFYLNQNRLNDAVVEILKLKESYPDGFTVAAVWVDNAQARVDVDRITKQLASMSMERAINDINKQVRVKGDIGIVEEMKIKKIKGE